MNFNLKNFTLVVCITFISFLFLVSIEIFTGINIPFVNIPTLATPSSQIANISNPTATLTLPVDLPTSSVGNLSVLSDIVKMVLEDSNLTIKVAFSKESRPYSYEENSSQFGFEIELIKELQSRWYKHLKGKSFVFTAIGADERIAAADSGEYTFVVGAISQNGQRCDKQDTTYKTICTDRIHALDKAKIMMHVDSKVEKFLSPSQFCSYFFGKKVGKITSTTAPSVFDGCANKPVFEDFFNRQAVIDAVKSKEISAYITDGKILQYYANFDSKNLAVISLEDVISNLKTERYTFLLPEGNDRFKEMIDLTLDAMKCDGTFDEIYGRYQDAFNDSNADYYSVSKNTCEGLPRSTAWELIRKL